MVAEQKQPLEVWYKKVRFKILPNHTEAPAPESFFNKVASSEFCEIFKTTFFTKHLRTTASKIR